MSNNSTTRRHRIAIAGISIESSTFTPYRSSFEDFDVLRGDEVFERHPYLAPGSELREAADCLGALVAEAPLDGLYFHIHGAMSVQGLDDAEGDLITAIRAVIGPDTLVTTGMDLHGNMSDVLFDGLDLPTCYRHAPHIDALETRERAARNLVERLLQVQPGTPAPKPHKAVIRVPILLPGEKTSTRIEPAKSLYARIPGLTEREGVTDVAYWIGFAWADQPRCQAAVAAYGDDADAVRAAVLELSTAIWDQRHAFEFVAPSDTLEACLDQAIASDRRPYWISDSGDNPGAGGADDVTVALAALVARPEIRSGEVTALAVSHVDPETVDAAWAVGVGGVVDVQVGGKIDTREPGPVPVTVRVEALDESRSTGRASVLRVLDGQADTGLQVVVTARRSQFASKGMFERLGLSMTGTDIVVVKMGYLEPDQYEAAEGWMMALTPGGVDQDLVRLGHSHIARPMIPFDAEIPAPSVEDLRV
jgi:microcystin degradation protein MlrC